MNKPYLFALYWILSSVASIAQPAQLEKENINIHHYAKQDISDVLFLHIDKTLYTNNETIWFSAYLIKTIQQASTEKGFILLSLTNILDHNTYIKDKYLVENGLGNGSMDIPDTIPTGDYQLNAKYFSDNSSTPHGEFTLQIKIRNFGPSAILTPINTLTNKTTTNSPKISIKFYPEGGYIISGINTTIGWESTTNRNQPISLKGVLYKDDTPIDTIESNYLGLGSFKLNMQKGHTYSLSALKGGTLLNFNSNIPEALENGASITIAKAVIDDTLNIKLFSPQPKNITLLIHNYKTTFAKVTTHADQAGNNFRIILTDGIPRGLAAVTLIDSLGRPLAERIFFAHYNEHPRVNIYSDRNTYNPLQEVKVKIKLTDSKLNPLQAIFSASVVQQNRLELKNEQDIESYNLLENELSITSLLSNHDNITNKDMLESILLVKTWRRYNWQGLIDSNATVSQQPLIFTGVVKFNNRALKKPLEIIVKNGRGLSIIPTTKDGHFSLTANDMIVPPDKYLSMSVNKTGKYGYTIDLAEPEELSYTPIIKESTVYPFSYSEKQPPTLNFYDAVHNIEMVSVTARGSGSYIMGQKKIWGANACGDYVDEYGYLNYPQHAGRSTNYQPEKGKYYMIRTDLPSKPGKSFIVARVIYSGCLDEKEPGVFNFKGVYSSKEFYGISSSTDENKSLSTLLWKSGIVTNKEGEAELVFKTGEIKSTFIITIQGVSYNATISGKGSFIVE